MYYNNLRKNEKREEILMARLIHTISSPVTSILIDSEILLDEISNNDKKLIKAARHLFNETQNLSLIIKNMQYWINREIEQPNLRYIKHSLLIPLKKTCEMFSEEDCNKGFDIHFLVVVNNRETVINTSKLDDF